MSYKIVEKKMLNPTVFLMEVEAPLVARKAEPGQFVILRIDEYGERVPFTVADFDREKGTITVIIQIVGKTTRDLAKLETGDELLDFAGPLGQPTPLEGKKKVAVIGGGLGTAIAYPQAKKLHELGADVTVITGFRNKELIILEDELKKKINADSENLKIQSEEKSRLDAILSQYKTEKTLSYANQVLQIHSKLTEIKNVENQILAEKKKIELFENDPNNKIESFENLKKPEKSVDVLQNELSAVSEEISSKNKILSDYQKIINDNLADTEKKDDIETEIERLMLEKREKSAEYEIFSKTLELLQKAKENLDANYSDPMKKGFEKYVKMLGSSINLIINTDLEVLLDDNGKTHKSNFLSNGYKDMVNFCSRMALVDALFENIKPPVILDDPFVNLDDEKIPNALQLVKEIAKENQVIYFACHKSRAV